MAGIYSQDNFKNLDEFFLEKQSRKSSTILKKRDEDGQIIYTRENSRMQHDTSMTNGKDSYIKQEIYIDTPVKKSSTIRRKNQSIIKSSKCISKSPSEKSLDIQSEIKFNPIRGEQQISKVVSRPETNTGTKRTAVVVHPLRAREFYFEMNRLSNRNKVNLTDNNIMNSSVNMEPILPVVPVKSLYTTYNAEMETRIKDNRTIMIRRLKSSEGRPTTNITEDPFGKKLNLMYNPKNIAPHKPTGLRPLNDAFQRAKRLKKGNVFKDEDFDSKKSDGYRIY